MPLSSITQITFDQQWFSGDSPVPFFDADAITLNSEVTISDPSFPAFFGYPYTMDVPETPPNPERIVSNVTLTSQSGIDDGFEFNGEFRPVSNGIVVTGNLSLQQKAAVTASFSIDAGTVEVQGDTGERIVTDNYTLNTFFLSGLGASDFGIIVPYVEQSIQTQGNTIQLPFFNLGRTGDARTTQVSLGGGSLTINDGTETVDQPVLLVKNIAQAGSRDFASFTLEADAIENEILIDSEEETFNKEIFKIGFNTSFQSSGEIPTPASYINDTGQNVELFYATQGGSGLTRKWYVDNSGFGSITFNVLAGAYEGSRPTTLLDRYSFEDSPIYAIIETKGGIRIGESSISGGNRYIITTPDSASERTENDVITVSNNSPDSNFSFSIIVDTLVNHRIVINGNDGQGAVFDFENGGTGFSILLQELSSNINAWINSAGWDGVSFVINDEIDNLVFTDHLNEITITNLNQGDSIGIGYTLPHSRSSNAGNGVLQNPEFYVLYDNAESTFNTMRDFCDPEKVITTLRNNGDSSLYGPNLGLPIKATNYNGTPDGWLDFPNSSSQITLTDYTIDGGSTATAGYGGRSYLNDHTAGPHYTFSNSFYSVNLPATDFIDVGASTMQDLCDWLNGQVPFISCSPGLYYGNLTVNAFRPNGNNVAGSWGGVYNSFVENDKVKLRGGISISTETFPNAQDQNASFQNISMITNNVFDTEAADINAVSNFINVNYPGLLNATIQNSSGNVLAIDLSPIAPTDLSSNGDEVVFNAESEIPIEESYILSNFSISSLVSQLNTDWSSRGFFSNIAPEISGRPDAITSNLIDININQDLSISAYNFEGEVSEFQAPEAHGSFVYLQYSLGWITDASTGIDEQGIQVAFGGYKSNGEFFLNPSPNAFFEPGFNSLFDVSFTAFEADEIYILVRTREDVDGTSFTSNANDYNGLVRYSNGLPSVLTNSNILTGSPFDAWIDNDWNSGLAPASFIVPAGANIMTLFADDSNISDSMQVRINNFPSELDEFAFLALNRTNLNASMEESRQGRSFGLVLDNRGIWDVLIGPEAEIQRVIDGEFDYLNFSFNHATIDSDESYNFELLNTDELDDQILNSIQLIPVPGFPKVSVLRIESGVRDYLSSTRSDSSLNSVDGCSVDIDIIAEGRESGAQGIARVTIFADYTCIFDVGLCDFFWNLTDPPDPQPPSTITNEITISYTDYIDCARLGADGDGDNLRLPVPILVTADKIPVFENGNALLLIKGSYSASVESFFFPSRSGFGGIQDPDCNSITDNDSLSDIVNREVVFVEGQDSPIVDPVLISEVINGTDPYLYIKPQFQFPSIDNEFECGANEVVIAAIGYQFKDWSSNVTTRLDDILIGVNVLISNSTFSSPEIEFCYKYYYRRES